MSEVTKQRVTAEDLLRRDKMLILGKTCGLSAADISRGTGIKYSTYLGYVRGSSALTTTSILTLSNFYGVYPQELLDPHMPLFSEHVEKASSYSIHNAVCNLRVRSMMQGKSYLQIADELGMSSRLLERIGNGTVAQHPDVYCTLAEYFGLTMTEFLSDCTCTQRVHEYFQGCNKRLRMKFIARLHGDRIREVQTTSTGKTVVVGISDVRLNTNYITAFVKTYGIPLEWIVDKRLALEEGATMQTSRDLGR